MKRREDRSLLMVQLVLAVNLLSAIGHGVLGVWMGSAWYLILGAYYAILAVMRFGTVRYHGDEAFILRFCGWMLLALAVVLSQTVVMSHYFDKSVRHHEIIMISLATGTCCKVTIAIVNVVRIRHTSSPKLRTIRNIALAAAAASLVTMQRSMLATFGEAPLPEAALLNDLTGSAACIFIFLLGLNMIMKGKMWKMTKSKLVQANEKIAKAVVEGYKKIETGVVGGYKKIEEGVTGGYKKIEDKFVDQFLTREGESVEEAKARLKAEQEAREAEHKHIDQ